MGGNLTFFRGICYKIASIMERKDGLLTVFWAAVVLVSGCVFENQVPAKEITVILDRNRIFYSPRNDLEELRRDGYTVINARPGKKPGSFTFEVVDPACLNSNK